MIVFVHWHSNVTFCVACLLAGLEGGPQKPPSAPSLASATRAACACQQTSREKRRVKNAHPFVTRAGEMARLPCIRASSSALLWAVAFLASVPGTHLPLAQLQFSPLSCCVTLHACMHVCWCCTGMQSGRHRCHPSRFKQWLQPTQRHHCRRWLRSHVCWGLCKGAARCTSGGPCCATNASDSKDERAC